MTNPDLSRLHSYPFEKLAALKSGVVPAPDKSPITLSIGEPQHPAPQAVCDVLSAQIQRLARYPTTRGTDELRAAAASWANRRFALNSTPLDPDRHVLPVNGTREALFAFAQCVVDRRHDPVIIMPNPFYQIYEGAALLAGAQPIYLNTTQENDFVPDLSSISADIWQRCQLIYICSPGNPTGKVLDVAFYERLLALADRYDFIVAGDECYSEIFSDENQPPTGLLQVAAQLGRDDFQRCVVFHSLSKRSNLPGLRSGFVAGDSNVLSAFYRYRTYHGCAMPLPSQHASITAWSDEQHVKENRAEYRKKFTAVLDILQPVLDVTAPQAGFYLWPDVVMDDETFVRELYAQQNVTALPGSYLSRAIGNQNPGKRRVRLALVAPYDQCIEAASRIRDFVEQRS